MEQIDQQINLEEWKTAINELEGIRLQSENNDAEIYYSGSWQTILKWDNKGKVSLRGKPEYFEFGSNVANITNLLAQKLKAKVYGDDGGFYFYHET